MLKFADFAGINNVLPHERMGKKDLATAVNVDSGLSGELSRRAGYSMQQAGCFSDLHEARGQLLALEGFDLVAFDQAGQKTVLCEMFGDGPVCYVDLPTGLTVVSSKARGVLTDGRESWPLAVDAPDARGDVMEIAGGLAAGEYFYALTYTRLRDGRESCPIYSSGFKISDGGLFLSGLPKRQGHKLNVYLSHAGGELTYFAGMADAGTFSFIGKNTDLLEACRTTGLWPVKTAELAAFWRGRYLTAVGQVLYATEPNTVHLSKLVRDFKQFESPITCILPVEAGIFVGTTDQLLFLAGEQFDTLVYTVAKKGHVTQGSGVMIPGDKVIAGDGVGSKAAAICICDGTIVSCMASGAIAGLTAERYKVTAERVAATYRVVNGIPQYIAIPQ